jgi:hypothetical protein
MNIPIKQQVYLPVKVEDELPKTDGSYGVLSKCNIESPLESYDTLKFQKGKFQEISNWKHIHWLKPQEAFVFTTEQLNQLLSNVIKNALNTAAEKSKVYQHSRDYKVGRKAPIVRQKIMISEVDKESIINTFEQIFKKYKV